MAEFRFQPLNFVRSVTEADACPNDVRIGALSRIGKPCQKHTEGRIFEEKHLRVPTKTSKLLPDPKDPLLPGPFGSCFDTQYVFSPPTHPTRSYFGQVYLPGGQGQNNCVTTDKFPLVIIAHADGETNNPASAHLRYATLSRHLASHGFVVVSLNRGTYLGWTEDFGDVLEETVHFFFANSFVKTNLSGPVAVIGHSAGGGKALVEAPRVRFPKSMYSGKVGHNLAALIQFAPSLAGFTQSIADNVAFTCRAYLGMTVTSDSDKGTWGMKLEDQPMGSVFRVYDALGKKGTPDLSSFTKDSVFIVGGNHYFQNSSPALAYVTAMLRRTVLGETSYNNFLKHQHNPPSLKVKVFQQHEDPARLSILRFDSPDSRVKSIFPQNVTAQIVTTFIDDEFSPHETKALKVIWDRTKPPGSFAITRLLIELTEPGIDASSVSFLSFRITQSYVPGTVRPSFDLGVKLNGLGELRRLKDYGKDVHYPIKIAAPILGEEQTKTAMKTILIPLADFKVNLSALTSILFDFGVNPAGPTAKAEFYIDNVELLVE